MTNEEKAREIAKEKSQSYGFGLNCDSSLECYNSALKMAEWKDEQMKEYLLQKKDGLKWRSDHIGKNHGACEELMDEIIKDLGL